MSFVKAAFTAGELEIERQHYQQCLDERDLA